MSETQTGAADGRDPLKIYPPVLAGILLLGGLFLHLIAAHHHHYYDHRFVHPHQLLGLLIVAAGVGLMSYAAALFAARDTTRNPYGEPTAFVVLMPYTFTRNPMYLGLTTVLIGFAIFFGSFVMLLAPIVFVIVIDRAVIPQEEDKLERFFGQQYLDYKIGVRRWL